MRKSRPAPCVARPRFWRIGGPGHAPARYLHRWDRGTQREPGRRARVRSKPAQRLMDRRALSLSLALACRPAKLQAPAAREREARGACGCLGDLIEGGRAVLVCWASDRIAVSGDQASRLLKTAHRAITGGSSRRCRRGAVRPGLSEIVARGRWPSAEVDACTARQRKRRRFAGLIGGAARKRPPATAAGAGTGACDAQCRGSLRQSAARSMP
jgi:hypothetical protein